MALLATTTASAASRVALAPLYVRPDGIPIATGATIAAGSSLESGIWQRADGTYVPSAGDLTFTGAVSPSATGTATSTCDDWTTQTSTTAFLGADAFADSTWWSHATTGNCATRRSRSTVSSSRRRPFDAGLSPEHLRGYGRAMGRAIKGSKAPRRTPRPGGATRAARATRRTKAAAPALLTRAEVVRAVLELANKLAPADVGDLLVAESSIHERAAALPGAPGRALRGQLELALLCLKDHAAGRCPQIPYFSISLLAAGVAYLADQLDFVPDVLPRIGMIDDALVMAVACDLARDGLKRYCVWKGIAPALVRRGRAGR